MGFSDDQFARSRPFVYHLTARSNVGEIRTSHVLHSAASLMQMAADSSFLRKKRTQTVRVQLGTVAIDIRDQQPLYAGNISFHGGWSFEDVVQSLNERVFFWPGSHNGPISYGRRHFLRYADERPVILRFSTADLYRANPGVSPLYCRYNSGSPRCSYGAGSPRGPSTFVSANAVDYTPGKVVEVTYCVRATLPQLLEVGDSTSGPWRRL
jgi:hypothetical protein